MSGTLLGAGDTGLNKTHQTPQPFECAARGSDGEVTEK